MICGCCGTPAAHYQVPHNLSGVIEDVYECHACRRRLVQSSRGLRWIKLGYYCADCATPVYRIIRHPRWGHPIALWPDPRARLAIYEAPSGVTQPLPYCGDDCCPDVGALPHHAIEAGAEPITESIGPCTGYVPVAERHARVFTPNYHAWLAKWLEDEVRLDREEYHRIVALHAADMAYVEAERAKEPAA